LSRKTFNREDVMRDAAYWIDRLGLTRHPEGGWFRETYRSQEEIARDALPARFTGARSFATAIHFLLTGDDFSALHRIASDELWHFHAGSALVIHIIASDGSYRVERLGSDPEQGEQFQVVVEAGAWFGAEVIAPDGYALVGCTVAPGFDFADFEMGGREELLAIYPHCAEAINRLTRG
jgi:uncharacterized protein